MTVDGGLTVDYAARKLRPVIKYPGGLSYVARWVVGHFPEHRVYCEPFAGGLNVLLAKPVCPVEWAGDTDAHLMNLYSVLSSPVLSGQFLGRLAGVVYSEEVFQSARGALRSAPAGMGSVADALQFYLVRRMSWNGEGVRFSNSSRLRGGRPGDENSFITMRQQLPEVVGRLSRVNLVWGRAVDLIVRVAGPDTLVFCDPPFPRRSRSSRAAMYGENDMSTRDHEELLELLLGVQAVGVFVCTYENELYRRVLGGAGWDCDVRVLASHMSGGRVGGVLRPKARKRLQLWFRV